MVAPLSRTRGGQNANVPPFASSSLAIGGGGGAPLTGSAGGGGGLLAPPSGGAAAGSSVSTTPRDGTAATFNELSFQQQVAQHRVHQRCRIAQHNQNMRCLAVAPDRSCVIFGGSVATTSVLDPFIVDPLGRRVSYSLARLGDLGGSNNRKVEDIKWCPVDEERLATTHSSGLVIIHERAIRRRDNGSVAVGQIGRADGHAMTILNAAGGALNLPGWLKTARQQIAWHHTRPLLAVANGCRIAVLNVGNGASNCHITHDLHSTVGEIGSIRDLAFAPHDPHVGVACSDRGAFLFDLRFPGRFMSLSNSSSYGQTQVNAVDFHPLYRNVVATAHRVKKGGYFLVNDWTRSAVAPSMGAGDASSSAGCGLVRPPQQQFASSSTVDLVFECIAPPSRIKWRPMWGDDGQCCDGVFATIAQDMDHDINVWDAGQKYSPVAAVKHPYGTTGHVKDFTWLNGDEILSCTDNVALVSDVWDMGQWRHHRLLPTATCNFGAFDDLFVVRDPPTQRTAFIEDTSPHLAAAVAGISPSTAATSTVGGATRVTSPSTSTAGGGGGGATYSPTGAIAKPQHQKDNSGGGATSTPPVGSGVPLPTVLGSYPVSPMVLPPAMGTGGIGGVSASGETDSSAPGPVRIGGGPNQRQVGGGAAASFSSTHQQAQARQAAAQQTSSSSSVGGRIKNFFRRSKDKRGAHQDTPQPPTTTPMSSPSTGGSPGRHAQLGASAGSGNSASGALFPAATVGTSHYYSGGGGGGNTLFANQQNSPYLGSPSNSSAHPLAQDIDIRKIGIRFPPPRALLEASVVPPEGIDLIGDVESFAATTSSTTQTTAASGAFKQPHHVSLSNTTASSEGTATATTSTSFRKGGVSPSGDYAKPSHMFPSAPPHSSSFATTTTTLHQASSPPPLPTKRQLFSYLSSRLHIGFVEPEEVSYRGRGGGKGGTRQFEAFSASSVTSTSRSRSSAGGSHRETNSGGSPDGGGSTPGNPLLSDEAFPSTGSVSDENNSPLVVCKAIWANTNPAATFREALLHNAALYAAPPTSTTAAVESSSCGAAGEVGKAPEAEAGSSVLLQAAMQVTKLHQCAMLESLALLVEGLTCGGNLQQGLAEAAGSGEDLFPRTPPSRAAVEAVVTMILDSLDFASELGDTQFCTMLYLLSHKFLRSLDDLKLALQQKKQIAAAAAVGRTVVAPEAVSDTSHALNPALAIPSTNDDVAPRRRVTRNQKQEPRKRDADDDDDEEEDSTDVSGGDIDPAASNYAVGQQRESPELEQASRESVTATPSTTSRPGSGSGATGSQKNQQHPQEQEDEEDALLLPLLDNEEMEARAVEWIASYGMQVLALGNYAALHELRLCVPDFHFAVEDRETFLKHHLMARASGAFNLHCGGCDENLLPIVRPHVPRSGAGAPVIAPPQAPTLKKLRQKAVHTPGPAGVDLGGSCGATGTPSQPSLGSAPQQEPTLMPFVARQHFPLPQVVSRFQCQTLRKGLACGVINNFCAMCEAPVAPGEQFLWLRSCGHGGHASHVLEWINDPETSECPTCGVSFRTQETNVTASAGSDGVLLTTAAR